MSNNILLQQKHTSCFTQAQLYEYRLIAYPSNEVLNELLTEKQLFLHQFGEQSPSATPLGVELAEFHAREEMEDTILRWIQRIVSVQKSFNITLNNFGGIPPHKVYARIQDIQPLKKIAGELRIVDQYLRSYGIPAADLATRPHIPIADELPENIYNEVMLFYSQRIIHCSFQVNELVLLRRQDQFDNYKQVSIFRLSPSEWENDNTCS